MKILIVYPWAQKGSNEYQALQQAPLKGNRIKKLLEQMILIPVFRAALKFKTGKY